MSGILKVLVVDDELHARRGLRTLLTAASGVAVAGEAGNGAEAIELIRKLKPDLVLLDVEMPDCSGLDVVTAVGPAAMPAVIFVTAYDQYAVAAFEASAVDYVLKPFSDERFHAALDRARRSIAVAGGDELGAKLLKLLEHVPAADTMRERFTVKVGTELRVFRFEEIDWIEADEYYCRLHLAGGTHLIRHSMAGLEDILPAARFVRVHRSAIVNIDRIAALEPMSQGDCSVILRDGTRIRMSRRRRDALADKLEQFS